MAAKTQIIRLQRVVKAPPAEAYRAFTKSIALREWFCDAAQADPRKGGRLYLWWNDGYYAAGEFTAVAPGKKVAFTWYGRGDPEPTQVQVTLTATDNGTMVKVAHKVGTGRKWAMAIQAFRRGWENGLENLQSVLETGQDLRYVRRPMLGISIGEFNAEVAAKLGVPVTEGIRLDGVLEGMSAQAAGLQKDDVIVGIGGKKVMDFPSVVTVLQSHRAGDRVRVVFYRGNQKRAATMKLLPRPLPQIPATPGALAEAIGRVYAEMDAELTACFEGVSEEDAAFCPAPGEWSAKETLAHLIIAERETHAWISDLINDDERWSDTFGNPTNVPVRVAASVAAYPSVADLLGELRRNAAETVTMLAALPAEFVAHKASYWRLGYMLFQTPEHVRTHANQIRMAIAAARQARKD